MSTEAIAKETGSTARDLVKQAPYMVALIVVVGMFLWHIRGTEMRAVESQKTVIESLNKNTEALGQTSECIRQCNQVLQSLPQRVAVD